MKKLLMTVLGAAGGAGLMVAVFWPSGPTEGSYHDFRGRPLPSSMQRFGPEADQSIKEEAEGLRITLPKDRPNPGQVGFNVPAELWGDFDITTTFEVLQAEEPETGFGVGFFLTVNQAVRIGRLVKADGQQVIAADLFRPVNGKRKMERKDFPCDAKVGRLRLKRTGTNLHYLWAPETTGGEFKEIHQCEYGEDIRLVRVVAETGRQPCTLDVRFADLRIATGREKAPSLWWLVMASVGAVGGGLAGWFLASKINFVA